jgi:hypothetical protein
VDAACVFVCLCVCVCVLDPGDESARGGILAAIGFLLRISEVDDVVIFKICLEFWNFLVTDIYTSQKAMAPQASVLMLGRGFNRTSVSLVGVCARARCSTVCVFTVA